MFNDNTIYYKKDLWLFNSYDKKTKENTYLFCIFNKEKNIATFPTIKSELELDEKSKKLVKERGTPIDIIAEYTTVTKEVRVFTQKNSFLKVEPDNPLYKNIKIWDIELIMDDKFKKEFYTKEQFTVSELAKYERSLNCDFTNHADFEM